MTWWQRVDCILFRLIFLKMKDQTRWKPGMGLVCAFLVPDSHTPHEEKDMLIPQLLDEPQQNRRMVSLNDILH